MKNILISGLKQQSNAEIYPGGGPGKPGGGGPGGKGIPGGKPGGLNPGGGPGIPGGGKGIGGRAKEGGPTKKMVKRRINSEKSNLTRRHHTHTATSGHAPTRTDGKLK